MSIGHFASVVSILGDTYVVTLSGASIAADDLGPASSQCEAGARFNSDGTVDSKEDSNSSGAFYAQISPATDWVDPNSAGVRTFYIRATESSYVENEITPAIFGTKNGTMGSWITLGNGQSREWSLTTSSNTAGAGDAEWQVTIEIASDSGGTNVLSSGLYIFSGEVS